MLNNRHNLAQRAASIIIGSVKNHPKMSFLICVVGCGLIVATYTHQIVKPIAVQDIPVNSYAPLERIPEITKHMNMSKWPYGYPVPINGLAYLKLKYWGYDDQEHVGELIINKSLAKEVVEIFTELHKNKFPIQQMKLIYEFDNSDDASMEANNTSAFNCRSITGKPGMFSQHSYGYAIDINPLTNPYVKESKNLVLPPQGKEFVDRSIPSKGKITKESQIYKLFTDRGWDWGGNWHDLQDFQHFEKRVGEKRNPGGI